MLLSNCAVCGIKKSTFIKNKILSSHYFKMNKIINQFLLTRDELMVKFMVKQPEITYNACRAFSKNRERIQKFTEPGNLKHLYRNELDKAFFLMMVPFFPPSFPQYSLTVKI